MSDPGGPTQEFLGLVEPVELQVEMERSFLDYAMSVITARALPGRARRPEARAAPDPLRDVQPRPATRSQAPEVGAGGRRGDGQVPPARRRSHLRLARPHGPGLLAAVPARRRPRELRLPRPERPTGRPAVHRGAPRVTGDGAARRDQRGNRRLHGDVRRARRRADGAAVAIPEPAGERRRRNCRGDGDEHPTAQSQRGHRRHGVHDRQPRCEARAAHEDREGARLPDRRVDPRQGRDQGRVHEGSRLHQDPRRRRDRRGQEGRDAHRRHRGAVPDVGRGHRSTHRRIGERPQDRRCARRSQRVGRRHPPTRGRPAPRRERQRRAQSALQAHADADELRGEHAGARRWRAPAALARPGDPRLHQPPDRGGDAQDAVPARRGRTSRAHRRGPGQSPRDDRRHHRPHPRRGRCRDGESRADGEAVLVLGDPSRVHPRHAAPPTDAAGRQEAARTSWPSSRRRSKSSSRS